MGMRSVRLKILMTGVLCLGLTAMLLAKVSRPASTANARVPQPVSRSFDFLYRIRLSPPAGSKEMRVWIPLPSSGPFQTISQLEQKTPRPFHIYSDPRYGNRYAYFSATASKMKSPPAIQLTFHAVRFEDRVSLSTEGHASVPLPGDLAAFLQPDRLVPTDGVIGELAREQIRGLTNSLQKARKIYEYVTATMHYDHAGNGWGRGDALWACDSHHGNCTDFHSLFIGMARAAGIPARFQIGFPLPENRGQTKVSGYHCWAEFYQGGVGWVPIDAALAAQEPAKHDYFFGAVDANRVLFSMGRDLELTPAPREGPLNYIVYPYVEVDGKPYSDYQKDFSAIDSVTSSEVSSR